LDGSNEFARPDFFVSTFIHDDFLLRSKAARRLYHDYAKDAPILDYHCHLDPSDLALDRRYANIAQLWVTADPYKHRAMRMAGIPEQAITGDVTDREKFDRWAATVPQTLGNPLNHWTALELKRFFDIDEALSPDTADSIWATCNERLAAPGCTMRGLLGHAGVECLSTSDRLLDDLAPHAAMTAKHGDLQVLPSLRADDLIAVESPEFVDWLTKLEASTRVPVKDLEGYKTAVTRRLDEFSRLGCRLADHGFDNFGHESGSEAAVASLFARRLKGEMLSVAEALRLRTGLLGFLGREYSQRKWIMQLHVGAQRRTSSRLRRLAGPAGGYSGIGPAVDIAGLIAWLDELESADALPRTILYPLNPADFAPLAVLAGSFVEDGVTGKLQLGPAWWFNDHAAGMRAQFEAMANYGLLSAFIGMTTDSRCPLSMVRQEYFRRVFCDWLGGQVEAGTLPSDLDELGSLVRNISCENARRFLTL
jgi:glucuronate isomerase